MNDKKSITKGLITIFIYFILEFFTLFPLYLLNIRINNLSIITKTFYLLTYSFITFIIIFIIYNKEICNDFKNFKFKTFFKKYFKFWFILLFFMILSNLLIQVIYPGSNSINEESIRNTFKIVPIYSFISACFFAPFMEEMIFRLSIRKIFKNKYLFIILSSLIFGGLHVLGNSNNIYDYLYLLPYTISGVILAYVYYESDNIFNSLFIHFIHNTVLLILQIIL